MDDKWISDFINGEGSFANPESLEFTSKEDLAAMRYYLEASEEMRALAGKAESGAERDRLMRIAFSHLDKVDALLAGNGRDTGHRADNRTDEELTDFLLNLL